MLRSYNFLIMRLHLTQYVINISVTKSSTQFLNLKITKLIFDFTFFVSIFLYKLGKYYHYYFSYLSTKTFESRKSYISYVIIIE